jgi:RHS repeat-associated protein
MVSRLLSNALKRLSNEAKYVCDVANQLIATVDANGNRTEYRYDALNRRVRTIDALGGITVTAYDKEGNTTSIVDAANNTTSYTYDALNRLLTDTNQQGLSRTYRYDAVGNRVGTIDRNSREIVYTYNNRNQLVVEKWLDSTSQPVKTIVSTYNPIGELTTISDGISAYQYEYDTRGNMTKVDNLGTIGTPRVEFAYQYDLGDNVTTVSERIGGQNGATTNYTYDATNRVKQITQSGSNVASKRVDFSYNQLGQLTSLERYRDLTVNNPVIKTVNSYDELGRVTQIKHGTNVVVYNYQYDAASRLKQMNSAEGTANYTYDTTNQLTGVDNTNQTDEAYSYDANGNRTNNGYQTGSGNRLLSDGVYNYEYDNEGNRNKRTEIATGKATQYVWDYRNRLANVLFKDAVGNVTKTVEYLYDVNNQRIGKKIDGAVTERYTLDRNQIALVFDGAGSRTHRYLYGTQIDQVLADEAATSTLWALADIQGTVKDLVDGNGTIVGHFSYDSFGNILTPTNGIDFRYGYTGREWDSEAGRYYYRARYYDNTVGRFISEDPIGFEAGDTNIYRYVGNSSPNATDPSGLEVRGVFDRRTRVLEVWDVDSPSQRVRIENVFSGVKPYRNRPEFDRVPYTGPIPGGNYAVVDNFLDSRPDYRRYFRLDSLDDRKPFNNRDDRTGRDGFLLHPGDLSYGCITIPNKQEEQWEELRNLILRTRTREVFDRSSRLMVILQGLAGEPLLTYYGQIEVR